MKSFEEAQYQTIIDAAQQSPASLVLVRMELSGKPVAVICVRAVLRSGAGEDLMPLAVLVDDDSATKLTMNGQPSVEQSPFDYESRFPE